MNAIRCCLFLIILMSSSLAFAGKSLFCANKFTHGDSDILADAGFFFDEAWLNCKDIKGNDFRLIVSINFLQSACYVIWFGTHKEYDTINVETIAFDTTILTNKN